MDVVERLSHTPSLLAQVAAQMPDALVRVRSGPFALVEQAWHLADLETEFGERVRRLLSEDAPLLPDFDGEKVAHERQYLRLDLRDALAAFSAARAETLRRLGAVAPEQWGRSGRQEGVGTVALSDVPRRMLDHDLAHLNEIADLLQDLVPQHPMIPCLRELAQHGAKSSKAA